VRQWYDNDGSAGESGASLSTTLPAGFSLNGGSTKVCLNPSTSSPAAPNGSELVCAASNEGSVWSGSDLQVSPIAGHYGASNGETSGTLPFGRKRYLNLQQCHYLEPGGKRITSLINSISNTSFLSGTNVSNTADSSPSCAAGDGSFALAAGTTGVKVLDLLDNRYLNLHQCHYNNPSSNRLTSLIDSIIATNARAGTNMSNTADAAPPTCGAAVAPNFLAAGTIGVEDLDLLDNRYVNLHQCGYHNPVTDERIQSFIGSITAQTRAGTNASNTPDAAPVCDAVSGLNSAAGITGVKVLDLLDTARGHGYVEYSITAPPGPTPEACAANPSAGSEAFPQDGSLTSTPSGAKASSGTITVDWSLLSEPPCPEDPIPLVDPMVAGAGLVAVAGAGFVLYRRRETAVA